MDIKKVLTEAVSEAVQKAIQAGTLKEGKMVPLVFTVPPQKAFGDFATNFALQAARNFHCPPRVIADAVVKYLDCSAGILRLQCRRKDGSGRSGLPQFLFEIRLAL